MTRACWVLALLAAILVAGARGAADSELGELLGTQRMLGQLLPSQIASPQPAPDALNGAA